jgi:hypothetical protein
MRQLLGKIGMCYLLSFIISHLVDKLCFEGGGGVTLPVTS